MFSLLFIIGGGERQHTQSRAGEERRRATRAQGERGVGEKHSGYWKMFATSRGERAG